MCLEIIRSYMFIVAQSVVVKMKMLYAQVSFTVFELKGGGGGKTHKNFHNLPRLIS